MRQGGSTARLFCQGLLAALPTWAGLGLARFKGNGSGRPTEEELARERLRMVEDQIASRGIRDQRILRVLRKVERHRFLPESHWAVAYGDHPLPIGHGQTISQPYIVALMTASLRLKGHEKVLEVGTGSGYQTAVLAEVARQIISLEIVPALAEGARALLQELGYRNVEVHFGDGSQGWPDQAPYDAILVAAAPPQVPRPLLEQLDEGGRLVIPVGVENQVLEIHTRSGERFEIESLAPVRFVPLIGEER